MRFYAAELETYRPGAGSPMIGDTLGFGAWGEPPPLGVVVADTLMLRVSDLGWVTPNNDPAGASLVYPPVLSSAFAVDRQINLGLSSSGAGVAWGGLRFEDTGNQFSSFGADRNVDARPVRILLGNKILDRKRGLWLNPPRSAMRQLFSGMAQQWRPDEQGVSVPVRDASLWLERDLQTATYAGTGGAEGTPELAGRPKPKLRGGTGVGAPVRNISPVLIDPVRNIFQLNDGRASVHGAEGLYENGRAVFLYAGDTTDLWAGTTPIGQFRQDTSKGLLQLGSTPVGQITCDAFGAFPVLGYIGGGEAASIALALMQHDLGVPPENIDIPSFNAVIAAMPHPSGWFWDGSRPATGVEAVGVFLAGVGARLIPGRDGRLRAMLFRAPRADQVVAGFTEAQIVRMSRLRLPEGLTPPPSRVRVGHSHNFTTMSGDRINANVRGTPRQQFLAEADRFESWGSTAVSNAYRRPSDPPPVITPLTSAAGARAVAEALGTVWGEVGERRMYHMELPLDVGLARDIGDTIRITYPVPGLVAGAAALIVGEQFRSTEETITFTVLV